MSKSLGSKHLKSSNRVCREQLYSNINRVMVRYSYLDRSDKIHVLRMLQHKVEEGRL